jgi:hypothetical protein
MVHWFTIGGIVDVGGFIALTKMGVFGLWCNNGL